MEVGLPLSSFEAFQVGLSRIPGLLASVWHQDLLTLCQASWGPGKHNWQEQCPVEADKVKSR